MSAISDHYSIIFTTCTVTFTVVIDVMYKYYMVCSVNKDQIISAQV